VAVQGIDDCAQTHTLGLGGQTNSKCLYSESDISPVQRKELDSGTEKALSDAAVSLYHPFNLKANQGRQSNTKKPSLAVYGKSARKTKSHREEVSALLHLTVHRASIS